jgi:hypothetical protein
MKHPNWQGFSRLLPVFVLVGVMLAGCGDDDKTTESDLIEISDFEGEWVITQYKATSFDDPPIVLELISLGGAMTFEADEDGDFTGRTFVPAAVAGTENPVEITAQGAIEIVTQDTLLVTFTPAWPPFLTEMRGEFEITGNTVTLYDPNGEFDFDGDMQMDPAIFEGIMVKNDGAYPAIIFTEDFEGHWVATGYTVTSDANPAVSLDAIAAGATREFDVISDGTALVDIYIPASMAGEELTITDYPAAFQLEYQDMMTIAFTPEVAPFLVNAGGYFTLDGNEYTLTDEDAMFDFGEGIEPASAVIEMERTSGGK